MPRPGRRRPRQSLASAVGTAGETQPDWFLRRREEGWNGRFASDGPSYFDVPGAMSIGDEGSRTRRDFGRARGGDGVGVAVRSSGKLAGKRPRVRTNMTPSLSRGGGRGGGSSIHTTGNNPDLYLMEKIYPDDPGPRSTAAEGGGARSLPPPPSHKEAVQHRNPDRPQNHQQNQPRLVAYPDPREASAVVVVDGGESTADRIAGGDADSGGRRSADGGAASEGRHEQQPHQVLHNETGKGGGALGQGMQQEGVLSGGSTVGTSTNGQADAGVLVAVTRAATGACMYREQLLVRLHALVDEWPMRSQGPSDAREGHVSHQQHQRDRDTRRGNMKPSGSHTKKQEQKKSRRKKRAKGVAKTTGEDATVQVERNAKGGVVKAASSASTVLSQSASGGSTTVTSPGNGRSGGSVNRRGKVAKTGDGSRTRGATVTGAEAAAAAAERRPRAARNLTYLAGEIKKAGLSCVEKIVAWSLVVSPETCRPAPFRWSSQDYLAKMHTDLDFVSEALGRDAPSFGRGNPLLLTRSEAAGQPRAGQVGRYYAATYVILDAVNRARDAAASAAAAAAAAAAPVEEGVRLPSRESRPVDRHNTDKASSDVRSDDGVDVGGADGGGGGGSYANLGGGGLGVIVVASDGASLGTIGEPPSPVSVRQRERLEAQRPERKKKGRKQQRQKQEQKSKKKRKPQEEEKQQSEGRQQSDIQSQPIVDRRERRADPDTGDPLEREADWSESRGELPEATSPKKVVENDEDLSDGYGESFEEFEDDDAPSDPPQATSKQQLQQGDSEAQRFRNKAEKMLRENEEKERSQGASNHALSREEGVDGTSGAVRDNQSPETDSTKVQQAEDGQFLRDDDGERVHDADVLKEREAEGERRLRQAEEEQAREKEAERRVLDKNETTRAEQMETEGGDDGDQRNGDTPTRIGEYNVECLLGDGAYGWVYKCRKRPRQGRSGVGSSGQQDSRGGDKYDETSAVVAIKQFKGLADMEDEHTKNYVRLTQQREADLALSLLHPNIVRCLGTLTNGEAFGPSRKTTALAEGESGEDGEKGSDAVLAGGGGDDVKGGGSGGSCPSGRSASEVAFLVFEHVPATLLDLIQDRPGGLSLPTSVSLLEQLLSAVGFLHQHGVVHRDVKPENILVHRGDVNVRNGAPVLKLCDLGTARKADEMAGLAGATAEEKPSALRTWTEYVGSRWYRAPEMLAGSTDYGTGVDVWACACLAAEMSSGRPLFPGEDEGELAVSMSELLGPLPPDLGSRLREMGYTPPPPRGRPTRSLEACLDGSTGNHEARRNNKGGSRASTSLSSAAEDAAGTGNHVEDSDVRKQNELHASLLELLVGMLTFDPASRLSAKECLLHPHVFGGRGDDGVGASNGSASGAASLGEGSGCSSSLTKGGESAPTTGAVAGRGGGDGGGLIVNGHVQAMLEGAENVSDLGDGQDDDESILEMAGEEGTVSDGGDDVRDEDEDEGGYDDDEYDEDETVGIEYDDASLVGIAAARAGVAEGRDATHGKTPTTRDTSPAKPSPPEETALLGEEGYVRKRVVEIEQKEEYYNPGKENQEATKSDADLENLGGEVPPQDGLDSAAAAASETGNAGTRTGKVASFSSSWEDGGDYPSSRNSGGNVQEAVPIDASPNASSYSAFDSAAAVSAAATSATAAAVAEDAINTALADSPGARGGESYDRPSRHQGELEAVPRKAEDAPPVDRATCGGSGMALGDEAYDSESFDDAEDEAGGEALVDIGGRTSFFPDASKGDPAAENNPRASKELDTSKGIVAVTDVTDVAAQGELKVETARSSVSKPAETEKHDATTENREGPEGVEGSSPLGAEAQPSAAAADEGAEDDDGAGDDGWRVAGAFRVLSASGPGGELAARATKGLLRRRNQRGQHRRGDANSGDARQHKDVEDATAWFEQALKAAGLTDGHARRSIEHAFSTSRPPEAATTDAEFGESTGGGAISIPRALEAFAAAAVAVDGEGLSVPRLIRLTRGLAECVDTELREEAEKCQAWATQARQGKRPAGRGDGSPLLECAEYLQSDSSNRSGGKESIAQRKRRSSSSQGGGVVGAIGGGNNDEVAGDVGNICAAFLVALCEAVGRGRSSATADDVHAASRLEAPSRVVCSLSPFILDSGRPKAERDEHLILVAVSIGLDEGLARQTLLRPAPSLPESFSCLLSPAAQAVLLRAALCNGGERRVNIVTTREEALDQIERTLEGELAVATTEGRGRGTTKIVTAGGGGTPPSHIAELATIVLNPYYLSPWGRKRVMGKRVEEGEGLGPRKELFELAARQLSERWRSPPSLSPSPALPSAPPPSGKTASALSPIVTATAREGTAEVELVINRELPSSSGGADAAQGGAFDFVERIKAGWRIKVGGQTRTLDTIEKEQDSDGSIRYSGSVTRLWMDSFQSEEVHVEEACRPVLVYQQGSESNWLDAKADRSNAEHRTRLRTLGALLALSVTNACRLPVELPHVFFRWLLLGGEAVKPGQPRSFQPSVKDMVTLDPSLARPFEALKDAVQSKEALDGLLEIEGLPSETPAEEYITHVVRQTFLEPVEWQVSEIRSAFFRALSPSAPHQRASHDSRGNAVDHLLRLLPRPAVLAEIIRGRSPLCGDCSHSVGDDGAGLSSGAGESEEGVQQKSSRREAAKDFDFREVFLVHEDHDLVACSPLREAFWSVVHSELSPEERRLLLLFVTGTDHLPEAGCETLSIEIPFELPGGGKGDGSPNVVARKALGQVPTAHTCDNVLELPNYWALLMEVDGRDEKTPTTAIPAEDQMRLKEQLREVLASRLRFALNNATGYTLDDLDDDSDPEYTTARLFADDGGGSMTDEDQIPSQRPAGGNSGGGAAVIRGEEEDFPDIPSLDDDGVQEQGATTADGALLEATKSASGPAPGAVDDSDEDEDLSRFLDREQRERALGGRRRSNDEVFAAQRTGTSDPGSAQEVAALDSGEGGSSENEGQRPRGRTRSRDIAGGKIGEMRTSHRTTGSSDGQYEASGTETRTDGGAADANQYRGHRHSGSDPRKTATHRDEENRIGGPGDGEGNTSDASGIGKNGAGGDGGYFDDDSIDFDIDDMEDLDM